MISRFFFLLLAFGAFFAGISELQKLKIMWLPKTAFEQTNGSIIDVVRHIDSNPGHAESGGLNVQVFEIVFRYSVKNVERMSNTMSPACSYCRVDDVIRITDRRPSELEKGTEVTVYVLKTDDTMAFLELSRKEDIKSQIFIVLLWLILVPGVAYLFSRISWTSIDESTNKKEVIDQ